MNNQQHYAAIMWLERWYRLNAIAKFSWDPSQSTSSSVPQSSSSVGLSFSSDIAFVQPLSLENLRLFRSLMRESYHRISDLDPDGVYGATIIQDGVDGSQAELIEAQHEGLWSTTLQINDDRARYRQSASLAHATLGVASSLQKLGCVYSLSKFIQGVQNQNVSRTSSWSEHPALSAESHVDFAELAELQLEAAWRAADWTDDWSQHLNTHNSSSLSSKNPNARLVICLSQLKNLSENLIQPADFERCVQDIRVGLADDILRGGATSLAPSLIHVLMLADIHAAAQIFVENPSPASVVARTVDCVDHWSKQFSDCHIMNFTAVECVLALRTVLLRLVVHFASNRLATIKNSFFSSPFLASHITSLTQLVQDHLLNSALIARQSCHCANASQSLRLAAALARDQAVPASLLATHDQVVPAARDEAVPAFLLAEAKIAWESENSNKAVRLAKMVWQQIKHTKRTPALLGSSDSLDLRNLESLEVDVLCSLSEWQARSRGDSATSIRQLLEHAKEVAANAFFGLNGRLASETSVDTSSRTEGQTSRHFAHFQSSYHSVLYQYGRFLDQYFQKLDQPHLALERKQARKQFERVQNEIDSWKAEQDELRANPKRASSKCEAVKEAEKQLRARMITLERELKHDRNEVEKQETIRSESLFLAMTSYIDCLRVGNTGSMASSSHHANSATLHDKTALQRLITLWFLHYAETPPPQMQHSLHEQLLLIPSYKLLPLVYQIAARLSTWSEAKYLFHKYF